MNDESNPEHAPMATLTSELTVKRAHLSFLNAAFTHAGFEVDPDVEGVTTDDGFDDEVRLKLRVAVPLEVLASAPTFELEGHDAFADLFHDLKLVA